jgi:H+/Cl- antiporter ClcA
MVEEQVTNAVNYRDVVLTIALLIVVILGFLFELAGETVPRWHTISFWAHRDKRLRYLILAAGVLLLIFLGFHFASTRIAR